MKTIDIMGLKKIPENDRDISRLEIPAKQKQLRHPLKRFPLYLTCQPGGTRTFRFVKNISGKFESESIGAWPDVCLAEAELRSLEIQKRIENPKPAEPEPEVEIHDLETWTLNHAFEDYLSLSSATAETVAQYKSSLDKLGWGDRLMISFEDPAKFKKKAVALQRAGVSNCEIKKAFQRLRGVAEHFNANLPKGLQHHRFPADGINLAYKVAKHRSKHHPSFRRDEDWTTAVALAESSYKKNPVAATHWLLCAFTGLRTWEEAASIRWDMIHADEEHDGVHPLFEDAPFIEFDAETMKIRGDKRAEAGMRPGVFRKFLNPLAVAALRRWHDDTRRERFIFDQRRDFVFPSRNSGSTHMKTCSDLLAVVRAELDYRNRPIVYYSNRRFYINQAARCDIEEKYRYGLTDHSTKELGIQESEYGDLYDQPLYEAEIKVGEQLESLINK